MQSLYEISDELLSIFNEIENNDGEVNEEQLQALEIAQENLQEKLASYKRAIRCWESDINACKEEEKRIKTARQVKENRIDKLKDRMLGAVLQFGYEGKPNKKGKTNHFYELPDGRIFTKTTESVEIDENRINILINILLELCCSENYCLDFALKECLYDDLLDIINDKLHLFYEGQEDFTIDDLNLLVFNYSVEVNLKDLICKYANNIKDYKEMEIPFLGLSFVTPKSMLKLALDAGNELSIAKIKETQSITIK